MDIKKNLPKIGKLSDRYDSSWFEIGSLDETTFKFQRPDYKSFRGRKYNTVWDCVSVIVGVSNPNELCLFYDKKLGDILEDPSRDDGIKGNDCAAVCEMFEEIKDVIDIGIGSKEIGKVLHYVEGWRLRESYRVLPGDYPFVYSGYFHSLSFLKWMHQNGYPIPDELAYHKNDFGELQWNEDVQAIDTIKTAVDYSKKEKSDLKLLIGRWMSEEGLSRKQVAKRLYKDDLSNGVPMSTLLSRVDRLRGVKTS